MLSFILGLVIGAVAGFIAGIFFYARKVYPTMTTEKITRETINSIVMQNPKGEFINVNPVEQYLKETDGEIKLGDILEDDRN